MVGHLSIDTDVSTTVAKRNISSSYAGYLGYFATATEVWLTQPHGSMYSVPAELCGHTLLLSRGHMANSPMGSYDTEGNSNIAH